MSLLAARQVQLHGPTHVRLAKQLEKLDAFEHVTNPAMHLADRSANRAIVQQVAASVRRYRVALGHLHRIVQGVNQVRERVLAGLLLENIASFDASMANHIVTLAEILQDVSDEGPANAESLSNLAGAAPLAL